MQFNKGSLETTIVKLHLLFLLRNHLFLVGCFGNICMI